MGSVTAAARGYASIAIGTGPVALSLLPTPAWTNRYASTAELPGQSPGVHTELLGYRSERCALSVTRRRPGNRVIRQLTDDSPPCNANSVQLADDRRPVHLVLASEPIDRRTLAVTADQVLDLDIRQPALNGV